MKTISIDEINKKNQLHNIRNFLLYRYSGFKCIECFKNPIDIDESYPGRRKYICNDCLSKEIKKYMPRGLKEIVGIFKKNAKALSVEELRKKTQLHNIIVHLEYIYSGGKCTRCFKNPATKDSYYPEGYLCKNAQIV